MDNPLFKPYVPEGFCREFAEIKGSSLQLGMYMSLVLGKKPLMDDWIPIERLGEFKKACRKYGVYLRENVIFKGINKSDIPTNVIGREDLTTTSAYGFPPGSGSDGEAHIFLSREKKILRRGMWYPVIIKDRVIFQRWADTLKYGYALGYPYCCIAFFRRFNDWLKYSHLYEAYKNTKGSPVFLCNPFLKDTGYSYIYHMPCSFDCSATVSLAGGLRKEILKREPGYVKLTDRYLLMPFLVFYERKLYCFEGKLKGDRLDYKKVYFCSTDKTKDTYGDDLKSANRLSLRGRRVVLYRNGRIIKNLDVPLARFAPEYPFLIKST